MSTINQIESSTRVPSFHRSAAPTNTEQDTPVDDTVPALLKRANLGSVTEPAPFQQRQSRTKIAQCRQNGKGKVPMLRLKETIFCFYYRRDNLR